MFGGPVLAVCLASDTGGAAGHLQAALAAGTLSFLGWNLQPPMQLTPEQAAKEAAMASRYSGLSSSKGQAPRLLPVGSAAATPCPSLAAVASGCGAIWDRSGTRLAVCLPSMVHISVARGPPRERRLAELCRVPLAAASAAWHGAGLYVSTSDGRTVVVVPPIPVDGGGAAGGDAAAAALAVGEHAAGRGSLRRQALVLDVSVAASASPHVLLQGGGEASGLLSAVLPPVVAPPAAGSFPGALAGGHLVSLMWTPAPASTAASLVAVSVRSPLLAAALALAGVGGAEEVPQASYVGSSAFAADCIARLPSLAQVRRRA